MNPLHEDTLKRIEILFPKNLQPQIIDALLNDCAKGILPSTLEELERIRVAVLKLSDGKLKDFQSAISLSQIDWRDVLVSAGFGCYVNAHKHWRPNSKLR